MTTSTEPSHEVAVDTNVLLSTIRPNEPQHSQVRSALRTLRDEGARMVVFPQVIAEFWSVATRPRTARNGLGLSAALIDHLVRQIENRFEVLPDRPETYLLWKDLVSRHSVIGRSVHDARIVAAMRAHGVDRLLTFDTGDFARYTEITVLDPATLALS